MLVEPTRSQNITVICLRSPTTSETGAAVGIAADGRAGSVACLILTEAQAPQPDHDVHNSDPTPGLLHIIVRSGQSVQEAPNLLDIPCNLPCSDGCRDSELSRSAVHAKDGSKVIRQHSRI